MTQQSPQSGTPPHLPQTAPNTAQTSWAAQPGGFVDAIKICFKKYVDFSGRASRSEYWWFWLFGMLVTIFIFFIAFANGLVASGGSYGRSAFAFLPLLGVPVLLIPLIIPSVAAGARRLHDTGKSGWLQLIPWGILLLAPLLLPFALIASFASALVLFLPKGQDFPNRFDYPNATQPAYGQPPLPG